MFTEKSMFHTLMSVQKVLCVLAEIKEDANLSRIFSNNKIY
jgi:hypothetical protein